MAIKWRNTEKENLPEAEGSVMDKAGEEAPRVESLSAEAPRAARPFLESPRSGRREPRRVSSARGGFARLAVVKVLAFLLTLGLAVAGFLCFIEVAVQDFSLNALWEENWFEHYVLSGDVRERVDAVRARLGYKNVIPESYDIHGQKPAYYSGPDIDELPGALYYARLGDETVSNTDRRASAGFTGHAVYVIWENGEETNSFDETVSRGLFGYNSYRNVWLFLNGGITGGITGAKDGDRESVLYLALTDSYVAERRAAWDEQMAHGRNFFTAGLIAWGLALLLVCYQTTVAGRRSGSAALHLLWIDRLPLDVMLFAECGSIAVVAEFFSWSYVPFAFGCALLALWGALTLVMWFSLVKNGKNRTFFTNTLIYIVLHGVFSVVKRVMCDVFFSGPLPLRAGLLAGGLGGLALLMGTLAGAVGREGGVFLFFLTAALVGLVCWGMARMAKYLDGIARGISRLRGGDFETKVPVRGRGALPELAADCNGIADGLQSAVRRAVKSERMKSELVSNVSHDLRTPLTSIITYVDLLKTEGLDSAEAPRYLEVVEKKAKRLQTLTDDLVEASRAASGSLSVTWEEVNLSSLINQAMGELSDKIADSQLDFRVSLPEQPLMLRADGRLLWRVLENLLGNVFKYAQPGTRVYVEAAEVGGPGGAKQVSLTIKNMSRYELNMDPAELTERFTRGDESRHSEGSGLGLSIVQGIVKTLGGECRISVDGDLFKVILLFSKDGGGHREETGRETL